MRSTFRCLSLAQQIELTKLGKVKAELYQARYESFRTDLTITQKFLGIVFRFG